MKTLESNDESSRPIFPKCESPRFFKDSIRMSMLMFCMLKRENSVLTTFQIVPGFEFCEPFLSQHHISGTRVAPIHLAP